MEPVEAAVDEVLDEMLSENPPQWVLDLPPMPDGTDETEWVQRALDELRRRGLLRRHGHG